MLDRRPPEIRALDDAAAEFDRLLKQVLAELEALAIERDTMESLQQKASVARLASTSIILEAGTAFITDRRARPSLAALQ